MPEAQPSFQRIRPRVLAFAITVLAVRPVVIAAIYPVGDPDLWWVAAAGRLIRATGRVPTQNTFSFTNPGHPWVMHEWLFAVPYAWMLERVGPSALALLAAIACGCAL